MMLSAEQVVDTWENFQPQLKEDLDQARKVLAEVNLLLEQSQKELPKLTQRSTVVNGQLQQIQANFDQIAKADIRQAYNAALDAQQRLLMMRGQVEKLQSDQGNLQRLVSLLESILRFTSEKGGVGKTGLETVELVVNAQESERLRLSRQMHDGPAQALSNFIVQAEIAARLFDLDPNRAKAELDALKAAAMNTFQKVRVFIFELRPMMLDDLGLVPTMKRYVDAFKEQTGMDVSVTIKGQERRMEPYLEIMTFRALQELMGNAYRHNLDSSSRVQINIQILIDDNLAKISVSDTGKGFEPEKAQSKGGIGLKLIRERVEMLGGQMEIDSAPGQGSRIAFQIPCASIDKA